MNHPLHSPDLVPGDLHFFGLVKKHLVGKRFVTDSDMKKGVTS